MPPAQLPGEGPILPEPLPPDPFPLFQEWFDHAARAALQPNPNAFTLATIDPDGLPSARILLCKAVEPVPGAIVFFTNYDSRKSLALAANPAAAAVFYWDALARQARLEGLATRIPEPESDAYFATRPWQSKVGAWASLQSRPIASRRELLDRVADTMQRFGIDPQRPPAEGEPVDIPRPPNWGGWRLTAHRVELWVSGVGRVHDRAQWSRLLSAGRRVAEAWTAVRLQP